ncbi:kinase-like domain-containing protein [Phaeosphaeriaceae sp. PMI808]|nr:kinase-like domain-containing protein [Phaeosphaeriaceae sp. PMI808]
MIKPAPAQKRWNPDNQEPLRKNNASQRTPKSTNDGLKARSLTQHQQPKLPPKPGTQTDLERRNSPVMQTMAGDFERRKTELWNILRSHEFECGVKDHNMVLPEKVKLTWAPRYYHGFYTNQAWYQEIWDKTNEMEKYLRIMSILIYISFSKWQNFKEIFIDIGNRTDESLPFELEELRDPTFLDGIVGGLFYDYQWIFCPISIIEREKLYEVRDHERLPWIDKPIALDPEKTGVVVRRTIAANYLTYNNQSVNCRPKAVAIKSVDDDKIREQEFENLRKLRGCLSRHKRIMVNMATILMNPPRGKKTYQIIYEVAAFDLNIFLKSPPSKHREKRNDTASLHINDSANIQPYDLILESRNLADALDYLHNRLFNTTKISLAHNDIKPENILVVYPDSTDPTNKYPVGKWKLADFGLSIVKDKKTAGNKHLTGENALPSAVNTQMTHRLEASTSVSKSYPKRPPGRYTAPELDQEDPLKLDGRRADIWSFGCVLAEVLAYAIQPDCVQEFRDHLEKSTGWESRFYSVSTKEVKSSFHEYLDGLPAKTQESSKQWVEECIKLVKEIVVKAPEGRPKADVIRDKLRDICNSMSPA